MCGADFPHESKTDPCTPDIPELEIGRRGFVAGAGLAGLLALSPMSQAFAATGKRRIAFRHLHTGETLAIDYWRGGSFDNGSLTQLNRFLRDWRTDQVTRIDPKLIDTLWTLRSLADSDAPFEVISAYRSPKTNAKLASQGRGVARRSYHMRGMAMDVRLPDRELRGLRRLALSMKAGGVGYYPRDGFLHIDTGQVRSWGG